MISCLLILGWRNLTQAQVYNMMNGTLNVCEGTLLDSEKGLVTGNYDNNENYVYSICIPGADSIVMTFTSFCTELLYDSLQIFDGPTISSPQIGVTFSGDITTSPGTIPGTIIARSGCLTLHFVTDGSVTCSGWEASWYTVVEEPEEPHFNPIANPACFSNSINVSLDQQIPCDSIYPAAFSLSGPNAPDIVGATPINCSGGLTNTVQLSLNSPINKSGNYHLTFTSFFVDACNDLWELTADGSFMVNDCPLDAEIISSEDTICVGECVQLEAEVTGGDPTTYSYNWSNGIPSSMGPHNVCPLTTTTYSLTTDDAGPAAGDVATKTITVLSLPVLTNSGNDTICRNQQVFFTANPSGGIWHGPGMTDNDTLTGRFRGSQSGVGVHTVTYTAVNSGCSNAIQISVIQFSAGGTQAACTGAAPFPVSGGLPAGGYWLGPNIDSNGVFNPTTAGSFSVTYYAPNGCSGSKTINVDSIIVQGPDTVCSTISPYYTLTFSPLGGTWSGTGIIHSFWGRFDPSVAGPGMHTLTYTAIGGCSAAVDLFVETITAGVDISACPMQSPFILTGANPPGGVWAGMGVSNPATGLYDPSVMGGNFVDTLKYSLQGCQAKKLVYVFQTSIYLDSLRFCSYDPELQLDYNNTGRLPTQGTWSGPGITTPSFPGTFDPSVAGPGVHKLFYDENTCRDSMYMVVTQQPVIQPVTGICINSSPFNLSASPPGGRWVHWHGNAITDSVNGTFDPGIAGIGDHTIIYFTLPDSCINFITITVDSLVNVSLSGLAPFYCYKDTNLHIVASPGGGIYSGAGVVDSFFNPLLAGQGSHTVTYTFGTGECAVSRSLNVFVGDSIEVTPGFEDSSICFWDFVTLSVNAEGGNGTNFTYTWDQNLPSGQFQTVSPLTSTTYRVTVSDGCSEPLSAGVNINVQPEITIQYVTNSRLCYGKNGFATVTVNPPGNYAYQWSTHPIQTTKNLSAAVGSFYTVSVTDSSTGCSIAENIELPGYDRIRANFLPNPNPENCITLQDPFYQFIDLSEGGVQGLWLFGDGSSKAYEFGTNPEHEYADTGSFLVSLYIRNEGFCSDSFSQEVCVKQEPVIFAPSSFSPNNDGINDVFKITGFGLYEFELLIFNRWGEMIFQTNDIEEGWNGTHNQEYVPTGGYPFLVYYKGRNDREKQLYKGMVVVLR